MAATGTGSTAVITKGGGQQVAPLVGTGQCLLHAMNQQQAPLPLHACSKDSSGRYMAVTMMI